MVSNAQRGYMLKTVGELEEIHETPPRGLCFVFIDLCRQQRRDYVSLVLGVRRSQVLILSATVRVRDIEGKNPHPNGFTVERRGL